MIELVIVVGLGTLAIGCTLAFLRRDEDALVRLWSRLVSPDAAQLRETLDMQLEAQTEVIKGRRRMSRDAEEAGTPLAASQFRALESEARTRRRALRLAQRMLSSLAR